MEISVGNQMKRSRGRYRRSRFRAKNLVNQLDFSMSGGLSLAASFSSSLNHFQSPAKPNLELQLYPPTEPFTEKKESAASQPQVQVGKEDNGTPEHQRQCRCKQTKCLKLYCECFASGFYCNGCNCVDCHNNIENEPARIAAVESILERNRNAFRSKTANSPHLTPDIKVQNKGTTSVGRQQRGCHCKKTFCLKKYCECFQAEILCSEHCKCLDCKNLKGCQERLVPSPQERHNTEICVWRASAIPTPTAAIQLSDSLVSIRKGGQEPLDFNDKTTTSQVNPLVTSHAICADSHECRSLQASITTDSIRRICSDMVVGAHADRIHATDVNEQKGMVLSRRVEALSSDEKVTMSSKATASPDGNHKQIPNAEVYMEQEKIVLTSFRDFLKKIITCKHETWSFDMGSM